MHGFVYFLCFFFQNWKSKFEMSPLECAFKVYDSHKSQLMIYFYAWNKIKPHEELVIESACGLVLCHIFKPDILEI